MTLGGRQAAIDPASTPPWRCNCNVAGDRDPDVAPPTRMPRGAARERCRLKPGQRHRDVHGGGQPGGGVNTVTYSLSAQTGASSVHQAAYDQRRSTTTLRTSRPIPPAGMPTARIRSPFASMPRRRRAWCLPACGRRDRARSPVTWHHRQTTPASRRPSLACLRRGIGTNAVSCTATDCGQLHHSNYTVSVRGTADRACAHCAILALKGINVSPAVTTLLTMLLQSALNPATDALRRATAFGSDFAVGAWDPRPRPRPRQREPDQERAGATRSMGRQRTQRTQRFRGKATESWGSVMQRATNQ